MKQHKSLKGLYPAMAAGLSETLWSMTDLAEMVDAPQPKAGTHGPYKRGRISVRTADTHAPTQAIDALRVLIEYLESASPIEPEQAAERRRKIIARMIETRETWNKAAEGPDFLSLDERSFRSHLKNIANDLGEQVAILSNALSKHLEIGEPIPPYYAWRICVILRRARMPDQEKRFLAAWCKHYPEGSGGRRYADLAQRYRSLNSN